MSYNTPPFSGGLEGIPNTDPQDTISANPPQNYPVPSTEFNTTLSQPLSIEAGGSARFLGTFAHVTDGPLGGNSSPWTTGPTFLILDGNGLAVATGVVQGVTIGAVTVNPAGSGQYFAVVQFGASMQPGRYVASWTGTYTPTNTQEPHVALPVAARKAFNVTVTKAPSRFSFANTKKV